MNNLLSLIIPVLIGTIITVNGFGIHAEKIIAAATAAANGANLHELATVVELYYSDHNSYPNVTGGEALINTLESEGYIRNRPLDPNTFVYEAKSNGQDYILTLAK